jgi:hypothetical protein
VFGVRYRTREHVPPFPLISRLKFFWTSKVMAGQWNKGGATTLQLRGGWLSESWVGRLLRRRRGPGRLVRAGDYLLLDVDDRGRFAMGTRMQDRQYALVRTYRYRCDDKAQPGSGLRLKRWYDFMVLRKTFRRGESGWRVVHGTWDHFGESAQHHRWEWRVFLGGHRYYVHRLVVHAKTGHHPLDTRRWQCDHAAGTVVWQADGEAGWCLGTWRHLAPQMWVDGDWEGVPLARKHRALTLLRRYRQGSMFR